jgi:DNA-binding transcriptional LysR family regulator
VLPQYTEHYFLLRRAEPRPRRSAGQRIGSPMRWKDAERSPLCMLASEMHNRSIIDAAFASAGVTVRPAIETNAGMLLVLAVLAGEVCSVMPGALVAIALQYDELEALPLIEPSVLTPIGVLMPSDGRRSRAQHAALALAQDEDWLRLAASHSGDLLV